MPGLWPMLWGAFLDWLTPQLAPRIVAYRGRPAQPSPFTIHGVKMSNNRFIVTFTFVPPPTETDPDLIVTDRKLVVTVNGTAQPAVDVPLGNDTLVVGSSFSANDVCVGSLTHLNAAGGVSPPDVESYTVVDVAPPVPKVPAKPAPFLISQSLAPPNAQSSAA